MDLKLASLEVYKLIIPKTPQNKYRIPDICFTAIFTDVEETYVVDFDSGIWPSLHNRHFYEKPWEYNFREIMMAYLTQHHPTYLSYLLASREEAVAALEEEIRRFR